MASSDAELSDEELAALAEVWRALVTVLLDRSIEDVRAEFFKQIPRERLVEHMDRIDRFLAATSEDGSPLPETE